jgi:hypothetical protein
VPPLPVAGVRRRLCGRPGGAGRLLCVCVCVVCVVCVVCELWILLNTTHTVLRNTDTYCPVHSVSVEVVATGKWPPQLVVLG